MPGGGGSQTVNQEPPSYLKPYLQDVAGLAQQSFYAGIPGGGQPTTTQVNNQSPQYGGIPRMFIPNPAPAQTTQPTQSAQQSNPFQWPEYYPNSTVVPFSNQTETALNMQEQRALNGSPLTQSAQQGLLGTLNGDYLTGGQGFDAAYQAAANKILPQVSSAFGAGGRLNSGLAQAALGQGLSDSFAGLYNDERTRQMQGLLAAPGLANQDYTDISQLANVGAQRESLSQQQLQDQINRYNFGQNQPYNMLQNYAGLISGVPAIGGSTTMPGASTAQNLLGGGLAGAGLAQMFGVGNGLTGSALAGSLGPWALGGAALMGLLG